IRNHGTLTISYAAICDNAAYSGGGGIFNYDFYDVATLIIINTTLSGNSATYADSSHGGAIWNGDYASLTIANSTISDNWAHHSAGGIFNWGATLVLTNATVTNNRALRDSAIGAGLHNFDTPPVAPDGKVTLYNTVVAGNSVGAAMAPNDVWGEFEEDSSHNLIGVIDDSTGLDGTGTQYGTAASPLDPMLEPLADNGGPTLTHALMPGSPAFDAGDDAKAAEAGLTTDQRGPGFPRSRDTAVDIGAFEGVREPGSIGDLIWNDRNGNGSQDAGEGGLDGVPVTLYLDDGDATFEPGGDDLLLNAQVTVAGAYDFTGLAEGDYWIDVAEDSAALSGFVLSRGPDPLRVSLATYEDHDGADFGYYAPVIVSNAVDEDDGNHSEGNLSLREAIGLVVSQPGDDVIHFSAGLIGSSIILTMGELVIGSDVWIRGPGADQLAIDGAGSSRVVRVSGGVTAKLSGLGITGGCTVGAPWIPETKGAGIFNSGVLTLEQVAVSNNSAPAIGGIFNEGVLIINSSTISGNSSYDGSCGGIYNTDEGFFSIRNSTISGNAASGAGSRVGGGIYNFGGAGLLINCTVTDNRLITSDTALGAGVFNEDAWPIPIGSVVLHNTIVAGNSVGSEMTPEDVWGEFEPDSSYNLIGVIDGSVGLDGVGTQYGTAAEPLDPMLGPLADNGGPTLTHAVLPGSPVIDTGSDGRANDAGLTTDQRGLPRFKDANDDQVPTVDIGAFEQQFKLNQAPTLTHVDVLTGAVEDRPFTITYQKLADAANEADPDGDPVCFRVEGVINGTLTEDGSPVVPGQTLLSEGESWVWDWDVPPDFGGDTVLAFAVKAWDGQASSTMSMGVSIEVTPTANTVNYAVLFSGGQDAERNAPRYYDNLRRLYETLVTDLHVSPYNVRVLYADGTEPGVDRSDGQDSDMSFATDRGSDVLSATGANLQLTLDVLAGSIDVNDHFFFWAFDHGVGSTNPGITGEEVLNGWHTIIADEDLAAWLNGINANYCTYVFAQCFSGGMFDDLLPTGTGEFGCVASTHYESSWGEAFAAAFTDALAAGFRVTRDAYWYAYTHDPRATDGEGPAGDRAYLVEHPWAQGDSFPIFAVSEEGSPGLPILHSISPLKCGLEQTQLEITYDRMIAAAEAYDPNGDAIRFAVHSVTAGSLTKNGEAVVPGETKLGYGESLVWHREGTAPGLVDDAFQVKVLAGETPSGDPVPVPIRIGPIEGVPTASDDEAAVSEDSQDAVIDVLGNDAGAVPLEVVRVGVALHGTASLLSGQVLYTPVPGFVGEDVFSYLMADDTGQTDMASVTLTVVEANSPPEPPGPVNYELTELPPPPGWAGLPEEWDWELRMDMPDWTDSLAADIGDEGYVVVGIERPRRADDLLWHTGGAKAGYLWHPDAGPPFWTEWDGYVSTNTCVLLYETEIPMEDGSGRNIVHGVGPAAVMDTGTTIVGTEYKSPDNALEPYPEYGAIWGNVGVPGELWQEIDQDILPNDINGGGISVLDEGDPLGVEPTQGCIWDIEELFEQRTQLPGWVELYRSNAKGINDLGHATGWAECQLDVYHAFFYDGTEMADIGTLEGDVHSFGLAINASDHVVGISGDSPGELELGVGTAFLWDGETMRPLGTLPGQSSSIAYDINDSGVIVGSSGGRAFVYAAGVMHDLNDLVSTTWTLTAATAINEHGQILATAISGDDMIAIYLDLLDKSPPTVAAAERDDGQERYGEPFALAFTFSEDVSGSLDVNDLVIVNETTGTNVDILGASTSWDAQTMTACWDLSSISFADGAYAAMLTSRLICDGALNHLDGNGDGSGGDDYVLPFHCLAGDVNGDKVVDGLDYNVWSLHYQQPGGWREGDLNGDETVDGLDYNIWSMHYLAEVAEGSQAKAGGLAAEGANIEAGQAEIAAVLDVGLAGGQQQRTERALSRRDAPMSPGGRTHQALFGLDGRLGVPVAAGQSPASGSVAFRSGPWRGWRTASDGVNKPVSLEDYLDLLEKPNLLVLLRGL
ncbi:MAG: hypothetical protein AMJ81_11530, partial [Phycisphaerae bacterium SM23_33]